jgi:hypothetical protein
MRNCSVTVGEIGPAGWLSAVASTLMFAIVTVKDPTGGTGRLLKDSLLMAIEPETDPADVLAVASVAPVVVFRM